MSARIHRVIVALGGLFAGLAALLAFPNWEPLGIPASVAIVFALAAAVTVPLATFVREVTDPSGV